MERGAAAPRGAGVFQGVAGKGVTRVVVHERPGKDHTDGREDRLRR